MNGPELLEHAAGLVNRRRREYGEPADLFEQVVSFFGRYFCANQPQPPANAMDMRIYGKGGTAE